MTVRTRFAPSPTGYLHIGGVRTALFCWLFARHHQGQFILRIDDTDQQRNVEEALRPILDGLRWLGIDWDEGPDVGGPYEPYYQSQRGERYQEAVEKLLAGGFAYRDYATPEELQAERQAAEAAKVPFLYSRRFMAESPKDDTRFQKEGRASVVRLKMPREGKLLLQDLVRGDVEFEWAREQDHVIQRADGTCLYHLANVVDDYDFKISHVIRAEEHLSNTPRQVFILESLGYPRPQYAHLPFVAEPGSRNKLSKRKLDKYLKNRDFAQLVEHGRKIADRLGLNLSPEDFNPVIVGFYEQIGYLPEAIVNYLALLGWSFDDKTEFLSREDLITHFTLERVVKASASFDPQKLWSFEDRHYQALDLEKKVELAHPFLQKAGLVGELDNNLREKLRRIITAAGDRIKVSGDIIGYADFFFVPDEELVFDEKDVQKRLLAPGAKELLAAFREELEQSTDFSPESLEKRLHDFIEKKGIKIGEIIHAVRVATTGKGVGPGLFDCLSLLGKESVLKRISIALSK